MLESGPSRVTEGGRQPLNATTRRFRPVAAVRLSRFSALKRALQRPVRVRGLGSAKDQCATSRPRGDDARVGAMKGLPNVWDKTMADPLLILRVSGQVLSKESFFVDEAPHQKRHHGTEYE